MLNYQRVGHFRTFFQVDYGDEWWFEFAFGMWRPFSNPAQRSMGPSWITRWENQPQISLTIINNAIHVFHPASNCKWPCPFKLTRLRILLLANMSFLCLHPSLDILWFYLLFKPLFILYIASCSIRLPPWTLTRFYATILALVAKICQGCLQYLTMLTYAIGSMVLVYIYIC